MSSASWSGGVACGIHPSPIARDAPQRGLARSADPDRRVRLLHRTRPLADVRPLPTRSVVRRPLVVQRADDRVERLVGDRAPLRERHAERVELAFDVAGADAEDQAPVRERVDASRTPWPSPSGCRYAATYTLVISRVRVRVRGEVAERRDRVEPLRRHHLRRLARDRDVVAHRDVEEAGRVGTPARRAPCRRRFRARAPTASTRASTAPAPGAASRRRARRRERPRRSSVAMQLSPATRPTGARCTRAGRTRRRRGRRR